MKYLKELLETLRDIRDGNMTLRHELGALRNENMRLTEELKKLSQRCDVYFGLRSATYSMRRPE